MKKLICVFTFALPAVLPMITFAQSQIPEPPVTAPSRIANINQILSAISVCAIIDWAFWGVIVLSIIFTLVAAFRDRKSTRLNSSHQIISYAVFSLKKNKLY